LRLKVINRAVQQRSSHATTSRRLLNEKHSNPTYLIQDASRDRARGLTIQFGDKASIWLELSETTPIRLRLVPSCFDGQPAAQ
jgi:hypothetical protein